MTGLRVTRRGWVVLIGAALLFTTSINVALSGKCWNNSGAGYSACAWNEGVKK